MSRVLAITVAASLLTLSTATAWAERGSVPAVPTKASAAKATPANNNLLVRRYLAETSQDAVVRGGDPLANVIHEINIGLLAHDQGMFSHHKEKNAVDVNLEVRFVSPAPLKVIGGPSPEVGVDINTAGQTSAAYAGLGWEWSWKPGLFAGVSVGGAVHDGKLRNAPSDRKELGSRLLFRGAFNFGYDWNRHSGIGVLYEHMSNGRFAEPDEGLENVGLRYQYRL